MYRVLSTLALAAFLIASAAASERTDVMSVVHQWIDALDRGDMKSFVALCTEETSILDDIPPYEWRGPGACARWWSDNDAFGKNNDITDVFVTLGKPLQLYVTGDRAYVVTRDEFTYKLKGNPMKQTGSVHTFVLRKGGSGWRITGEAWADTSSATQVVKGS
jgi:ketosteroid isomerase-like protein